MKVLKLQDEKGKTVCILNTDRVQAIGVRENRLEEGLALGENCFEVVAWLASGSGPNHVVLGTAKTKELAFDFLTQVGEKFT